MKAKKSKIKKMLRKTLKSNKEQEKDDLSHNHSPPKLLEELLNDIANHLDEKYSNLLVELVQSYLVDKESKSGGSKKKIKKKKVEHLESGNSNNGNNKYVIKEEKDPRLKAAFDLLILNCEPSTTNELSRSHKSFPKRTIHDFVEYLSSSADGKFCVSEGDILKHIERVNCRGCYNRSKYALSNLAGTSCGDSAKIIKIGSKEEIEDIGACQNRIVEVFMNTKNKSTDHHNSNYASDDFKFDFLESGVGGGYQQLEEEEKDSSDNQIEVVNSALQTVEFALEWCVQQQNDEVALSLKDEISPLLLSNLLALLLLKGGLVDDCVEDNDGTSKLPEVQGTMRRFFRIQQEKLWQCEERAKDAAFELNKKYGDPHKRSFWAAAMSHDNAIESPHDQGVDVAIQLFHQFESQLRGWLFEISHTLTCMQSSYRSLQPLSKQNRRAVIALIDGQVEAFKHCLDTIRRENATYVEIRCTQFKNYELFTFKGLRDAYQSLLHSKFSSIQKLQDSMNRSIESILHPYGPRSDGYVELDDCDHHLSTIAFNSDDIRLRSLFEKQIHLCFSTIYEGDINQAIKKYSILANDLRGYVDIEKSRRVEEKNRFTLTRTADTPSSLSIMQRNLVKEFERKFSKVYDKLGRNCEEVMTINNSTCRSISSEMMESSNNIFHLSFSLCTMVNLCTDFTSKFKDIEERFESKNCSECGTGLRRIKSLLLALLFGWLNERCKEWNADISTMELLENFDDDKKPVLVVNSPKKTSKKKNKKKKSGCSVQKHKSVDTIAASIVTISDSENSMPKKSSPVVKESKESSRHFIKIGDDVLANDHDVNKLSDNGCHFQTNKKEGSGVVNSPPPSKEIESKSNTSVQGIEASFEFSEGSGGQILLPVPESNDDETDLSSKFHEKSDSISDETAFPAKEACAEAKNIITERQLSNGFLNGDNEHVVIDHSLVSKPFELIRKDEVSETSDNAGMLVFSFGEFEEKYSVNVDEDEQPISMSMSDEKQNKGIAAVADTDEAKIESSKEFVVSYVDKYEQIDESCGITKSIENGFEQAAYIDNLESFESKEEEEECCQAANLSKEELEIRFSRCFDSFDAISFLSERMSAFDRDERVVTIA